MLPILPPSSHLLISLPRNDTQQVQLHIVLVSGIAFQVAVQLLSRVWLWPHGLQHARLHYVLEFAQTQVHGWLKLMSWWCHPTISSTVAPFSCPQSFTFIKRLFSSSSLSAIRVVSSAFSYTYMYIYFYQILFPFKLLQNIEQSSLIYTVGPCWLSILNIVVCVSQSI